MASSSSSKGPSPGFLLSQTRGLSYATTANKRGCLFSLQTRVESGFLTNSAGEKAFVYHSILHFVGGVSFAVVGKT